ncbi:MAG: M20 aminoacylase family protein [Pseudorhodoplanes sp.]
MATASSIDRIAAEARTWRRWLHSSPELNYDLPDTSGYILQQLTSFGCDEVAAGIAQSGIVAVIRGKKAGSRVLAFRADMDALPIQEQTGLPYASKNSGRMHACGHDGHSATLLGAAKFLAESRDFEGSVVAIFQPAEETGAGGKAMVEAGILDKYGIEEVYGLHNLPGLPVGEFATSPGSLLAAASSFEIVIRGKGGHAAMPHSTIDPLHAGCAMVLSLQSIVSRNVNPADAAVVSVTGFNAGDSFNIIPDEIVIRGTVRALDTNVQRLAVTRVSEIVEHSAHVFKVSAVLRFVMDYPVTVNHPEQTGKAIAAAGRVTGTPGVSPTIRPIMVSEDFSFMLQERPGCFMFIGNGSSANLHHPAYDFNDGVIEFGMRYWISLAGDGFLGN